jgi:hypothetical protein
MREIFGGPRARMGGASTSRMGAALAASLGALLLAGGPDARAEVTAYPAHDAKTASPRTQISFRGIAPAGLTAVRVVGSRSGRHRGRVLAHSDGLGGSFVPARRFRGGERVTVTADFEVVGTGSRAYGFRVARFARNQPLIRRHGRRRAAGTMRLVTRPDLRPPSWDVRVALPGNSDAEIFAGPKLFARRRGQEGVQILTPSGRVRYWLPMAVGQKATDVRVQSYRGAPAMTFWRGYTAGGQGRGEGVVMSPRYDVLARVRMGNGYAMDLHEFRLTPRGTALAIAYQAVRANLRRKGGSKRGSVVDNVIQEIDLPTGLVLYEWHSVGTVGLRESDGRPRGRNQPWDYFHANSVYADGPDGFIVSARHTSAVYRISRATGAIDWRLGGSRSDFRLGRGAAFARQHDAEVQPDGTIRIFDNSARRGRRRSRIITLRLDRTARTATLVAALSRGGSQFAGTQGNASPQPNGSAFINWGSRGGVSEIDSSNRLLFDAWLPQGWDNYRAYRANWTGVPYSRPEVVARAFGPSATNVYASWNGATEVVAWRILAGPTREPLSAVATAPWDDLETAVRVASAAPYIAVQALDANGRVLGISHITQRG